MNFFLLVFKHVIDMKLKLYILKCQKKNKKEKEIKKEK